MPERQNDSDTTALPADQYDDNISMSIKMNVCVFLKAYNSETLGRFP